MVRARWYGSDVSIWSNAPVQWNIGNGWENIPREYIQSVGTTAAAADTDNNKPNMLRDLAPYCAYLDADGDLFSQNGNFFALDPTRCERILNSECLTCPDNLFACEFEEENCLDPAVDATNTTVQQSPECFFKVVRVTPRTFTPCLLYTSPSPRDQRGSRMPSSA